MNCLHSCLNTSEGSWDGKRDLRWQPCWFWDLVQSVIYGDNREDMNIILVCNMVAEEQDGIQEINTT